MPDLQWYCYVLLSPDDAYVHYIGVSSFPEGRLFGHLQEKRACTQKGLWLKSLSADPIVSILDSGRGDTWRDCERRWIRHYLLSGHPLLNQDLGGLGSGPFPHKESTRLKMKEAQARPDVKQKVVASSSRPRGPHTSEWKQRVSASVTKTLTGRKCSDLTKVKIHLTKSKQKLERLVDRLNLAFVSNEDRARA